MGCYNDELLFIHIPKTGGTAIKTHLWEHVGGMIGQMLGSPEEDKRKPTRENPFPIGHIPLHDCCYLLQREPESFKRIVAVIRNPYEQQVSQWLFWAERYRQGGVHPHDIAAARHATIHSWLEDRDCDFHRWYIERIRGHNEMGPGPWDNYKGFWGYYVWWLQFDNRMPSNLTVLHMDKLHEEYPQLLKELYPDRIFPPLPVVNRGGWDKRMTMNYIIHGDRKEQSYRALDLIEAKFRWAFDTHYRKFDRSQLEHLKWHG